ncbi:MAG TPA: hypothetical protein DCE41_34190 [Cytophagales bacterium]|nr:hypothetical protein [Cytophagales bacterium]HAA21579.1 hypothetical protein [Cytophagales bacterium]HAP59026.1 hypothetical protein [Cytophagales bacterium]
MWPIKSKFLDLHIRKRLKATVKRRTVRFEDATQVGILFPFEGPVSAGKIRIFADRLKEQGKQVTLLTFSPQPLENPLTGIECYTRKDFSLMGAISNEAVQSFTNQTFDYLFYFGPPPVPEMQCILAESKAGCRIGAYQPEATAFFELMIQGPDPSHWDDLFREYTAYTQKLQTAS